MSDEYTPTTASVRNCYVYADPHDGTFRREAEKEFDRWHAKDRADTVMAFANHFLRHEDWKKARKFANDILEGKA